MHLIIIAIVLFAVGLCLLGIKYRIVLGGFLYEADILDTNVEYAPGGLICTYDVGFTHDEKYLKKRLLNFTKSPKIYGHDTFLIYYNPKYPKVVVLKSFGIDMLALALIALGAWLI